MLYLDCADRKAFAPLLATGMFDGVTTNPSVLAKANLGYRDLPAVYESAMHSGARRFFAQAVGLTTDELRASARHLLSLGPNVHVKIGCSRVGLPVIRELAADGVSVLATAVYHPAQAQLAIAAGAAWMAPYVSRAEKAGVPADRLIGQSAAIIRSAGSELRILAASLHSLDQTAAALAAGAHDATLNSDVAELLLEEPDTMEALVHFEQVHRSS